MCGISGELRLDGRRRGCRPGGADDRAHGRAGTGRRRACGCRDRVALGHRRLSIIDLSPAGDQPMVDDELGLVVVFNGCIYNHLELRRELEGHGYRFRSHSDTEVLLKG